MKFATATNTNQQKLNFQFQEIVDVHGQKQGWVEMLYRPTYMMGHPTVEKFFKSLTTLQKIDLDIKIFKQLTSVLQTKAAKRLSVNLMPYSLLSPQFRAVFRKLLENQMIDPRRLCIEIVEIDSLPPLCSSSIELLQIFRNQGGWIALDDFGSGFAHWELLQMGLIDIIKVASQNFSHINTSDFTYGLSKFAKSLNIAAVLEGVESQDEYIKGVELGFDYFQGWYFNPGTAQ